MDDDTAILSLGVDADDYDAEFALTGAGAESRLGTLPDIQGNPKKPTPVSLLDGRAIIGSTGFFDEIGHLAVAGGLERL